MKHIYTHCIFICCIVSVATAIHGQRDQMLGITHWHQGLELDWSDFRGLPINDTLSPIFMDVRMGYRPMKTTNILVANAIESQAYMLNHTSYVAEPYRTTEVLYYLKTYFDLAGLYSREYRNRLIRSGQSTAWRYFNQSIIDDVINSEWKHDIDLLASETGYGAITEKVYAWEQHIAQRLDTMASPVFEKSPWGFSFSLELGSAKGFSGFNEVMELRDPSMMLTMDLIRRPWSINLGLGLHFLRLKESIGENQQFVQFSEPTLTYFSVLGGYDFYENDHLRLTAKAGPGFNWLRYPDEESEESDFALSGVAGLVGDYKIKSRSARKDTLRNLSYWGLRASILYHTLSYENTSGIEHISMTIGVSYTIGGGRYVLH